MEKISVIIPVYRVEAYLDKCVSSVVEQTYRNLEIILVDDGSPDNCPFMCDAWVQRDSRIRVIHKQNGGLSDARNVGLDRATGEYISFVDSDDYLTPDCMEKLHGALLQTGAEIAVGNFCKVDENGKSIPKLLEETVSFGVYSGKKVIYSQYRQHSPATVFVIAWGKLYRKEVFSRYRFAKGRINEDEFAFFHIYGHVEKVVSIPDEVYYYLQRGDSITGKPISRKRIEDNLAYWKERLALSREDPVLEKKVAVSRCVWIFLNAFPNLKKDDPLTRPLEQEFRRVMVRNLFDKKIDLPAVHKAIYFLSVCSPWLCANWKKKLGI